MGHASALGTLSMLGVVTKASITDVIINHIATNTTAPSIGGVLASVERNSNANIACPVHGVPNSSDDFQLAILESHT
jgi:hypothetical protein